MKKHTSWICLLFVSMSCTDPAVTPIVDDTGELEDAMDTNTPEDGWMKEDSVENDVQPNEEVSLECTVDSDCEGSLTLRPCESASCTEGVCVVKEGPLCCNDATDCDPAMFPESEKDCIDTVCEDSLCQSVVTSEPCCLSDESCSGIETACCETAICETFTCVVKPLDNCCSQSSDCDDQNDVTSDVCIDACSADGCLHYAPPCADVVEYLRVDFDNNTLQGMNVSDSHPQDEISWHLTNEHSVSYPSSVHLGHPLCPIYYSGPTENCVPVGVNESTPFTVRLQSTTLTLDGENKAFLGFWVRLGLQEAENALEDSLRVLIETESSSQVVWTSVEAFGVTNSTLGDWSYQVVDLSTVSGEFTVVFEMVAEAADTYQGSDGSVLEGVYLDEIVIQTTCDAASCSPETPCPTDGNGCTHDECTPFPNGETGVCAYPKVGSGKAWTKCQPCGQPADCGDNDCYAYNCEANICDVELAEKCCASYTLFPEATVPPETVVESFESNTLEGWTLDDPTDDNVSWQIKNTSAYEGSHVLYFGDPVTGTFEAFGPNGEPQPAQATLWSKMFPINKEQYRSAMLIFWLHMSTQFNGGDTPDQETPQDTLTVLVQNEESGEIKDVWNSAETIGSTTNGKYVQVGIDLSVYEKKTVRFGFQFDSVDASNNGFGGVHVDSLALHMICGAIMCQEHKDCDDGNACTTDLCTVGKCQNEAQPGCCTKTADCNDGDPCTLDKCVNNTCQHPPDPNTLDQCCPDTPWTDNTTYSFDVDLAGFTVETDTPPVTWYVDDTQAYSGSASLHFANPLTGVFHLTGEAASGRLVSPQVTVPAFPEGTTLLEFRFYMHTEWTEKANWQKLFSFLDELSVKVRKNGVTDDEPIWTSHFLQNSTFGTWVLARVPLDFYQGETIQLVFEFGAGDAQNNMFPGAFIDDVRFTTSCVTSDSVECLTGSDCAGSGLCKLPICTENFACSTLTKNTAACCEPSISESISHDFESIDAVKDWTLESCELNFGGVDESVTWHVATDSQGGTIKAQEGNGFLYFGNGTDFGGKNELGSCGSATTPPASLAPDVPWNLTFWSYMDTEKFPGCEGAGAVWVDDLEISIIDVDANSEDELWSKSELACDEYGKWVKHTYNLSFYAGKTIQLRFDFSSWDQAKNDGAGIGIDSIKYEKGCPEED